LYTLFPVVDIVVGVSVYSNGRHVPLRCMVSTVRCRAESRICIS